MKKTSIVLLAAIIVATVAVPVCATQIQSINDCTVGERVKTSDGHKGAIMRIDPKWQYCYVKQDDTGKEVGYLYSLLETEAPTNDKLVIGSYDCWVSGDARHRQNTAGKMRVTSQTTYEVDGKKGALRLEPSGKIVFQSGPYFKLYGKLLSGHRIGINDNGGNFYGMTCDPSGK